MPAYPLSYWPTAALRNAPTDILVKRLKSDINLAIVRRRIRAYWRAQFFSVGVAAMLPVGLDDIVILDRSRAKVEAANVQLAFTLIGWNDHADLMRTALAVILWEMETRRTVLDVAARYCRTDAHLDRHLTFFLNKRRCTQFKIEMRI